VCLCGGKYNVAGSFKEQIHMKRENRIEIEA